ncbi:Metalloprotease [Hypoxylon sp. FL0543]|nr:Metalloprotease [Hypoxylon sp. FL0543]
MFRSILESDTKELKIMSSKPLNVHYEAHVGPYNVSKLSDEDRIRTNTSMGKRSSIDLDGPLTRSHDISLEEGSSGMLVMVTEEATNDHQSLGVEPGWPVVGALELRGNSLKLGQNLTDKIVSLHYCCRTELDSTAAINLGFNGTIYRWRPKSTIKYNVNRNFPRSKLEYAVMCLEEAGGEWNRADIGVKFERVADDEPAVFQLVYATSEEDCLASAFFPGAKLEARQLVVYEKAFEECYYRWMTNLFCHELGHILGLRHEFAPEREKSCPCVVWGSRNASSVMNYFGSDLRRMRLQRTDYGELREFYRCDATEYRSFPIVDVDPICLDTSLASTSGMLFLRLRGAGKRLLRILRIMSLDYTYKPGDA